MSNPKIINVGGEGGFGGLYNALFGDGHEQDRIMLLAILTQLELGDLGRARDAWVEKDLSGEGDVRYALYTRNGGGNRPDYAEQIAKMQANPNYLEDRDDTFDTTYATFYFRLPHQLPDDAPEKVQAEWVTMRQSIVEEAVEPVDTTVLWERAIEALEDPEVADSILKKTGLGEAFQEILNPSEEDK